MKKTLFTLLIIAISQSVYSQIEIMEEPREDDNKVLAFAEQKPEYPGGDKAMFKFFEDNLKYPEVAKNNGIEGTVVVRFVVRKDGSLSNAEILRGIGGGCDSETLRLINVMPKWIPGKNNGKLVNVTYTLPVKFKM